MVVPDAKYRDDIFFSKGEGTVAENSRLEHHMVFIDNNSWRTKEPQFRIPSCREW